MINSYSKANNKYVQDIFNPKKESNTYSTLMQTTCTVGQCLSIYLMEILKSINGNIDVMNMPDYSPKGYILEVELKYPRKLHDLHPTIHLLMRIHSMESIYLNYLLHYVMKRNTLFTM